MNANPCNFQFQTHPLLNLLQQHGLLKGYSSDLKDFTVQALTTDSRQVTSDHAFLAYQGVQSDGHQFLPLAIAAGAKLLIIEDPAQLPPQTNVPWLHVANARAAWSWVSALGYGMPQERLRFIGITGTNGKTSTVWMLRQMLRHCGIGVLSLGTLGTYFGDRKVTTTHTTPDPPQLFAALSAAVTQGLRHVVMEVSSHALAHHRVLPLQFSSAGFTSFSRDHLDFHQTMAAYWDAKWSLFQNQLSKDSRAVVNAGVLSQVPKDYHHPDLWVYGSRLGELATDHTATVLTQAGSGATRIHLNDRYQVTELSGTIPYLSDHAAENFTLALLLLHKEVGHWLSPAFWPSLAQVPGRLERVGDAAGRPKVLVDYAHTPDALEKALRCSRDLTKGKVICVFGCGGERDQGKRPLMGAIAGKLSDLVVVTSDNPRSEEPARIIDDILQGKAGAADWHRMDDRRDAIALAIKLAKPDDVVLIAGKGHEDYQIIGKDRLPFDDRVVAHEELEAKYGA